MKIYRLVTLCAALAIHASAQTTLVLDNFNSGSATGSVIGGTSWVGQITQNLNSITVAGSAKDDSGWGISTLSEDVSAFSFLKIVAQRDGGNLASSLVITFEDDSLNTITLSISSSMFSLGSLSTVYVPVAWPDFNTSAMSGWTMGGGSTGAFDFRMTIDELALTTAVPEPSTYAMILCGLALGFISYLRRRAA